jgi:HK97 family phage prohead protease
MLHKAVEATTAVADKGRFEALAATWSVDRVGDQIVPGAFRATIAAWQSSGKRIPVHWDHQAEPHNIIGFVDPTSLRETTDGLLVAGKLDLEESEVAREAWRAMRNNAVALSFGYVAMDESRRPDGVNELRAIDLFEVSVCPAPANPDTRFLSLKSTAAAEASTSDPAIRTKWHRFVRVMGSEALAREILGLPAIKGWDGSASRFTDEEYAAACIVDRGDCADEWLKAPAKQRYSVPIRDPGESRPNPAALGPAAAALAGGRSSLADVFPAAIERARMRLLSACRELGVQAPESLLREVKSARGELRFASFDVGRSPR